MRVETDVLENNFVEIVLATTNPHKLMEIEAINKNPTVKFEIVDKNFNPDETGMTFEENAYIKAFEAAKLTNKIALADDSGLCIDYLNGEPGIRSARYEETPQKRIEKVLKNLDRVPSDKRTAHFACAMALVNPDGQLIHKTYGEIKGMIDFEVKGNNGFGYDPIFYVPEYKMTLAEISEDEKNKMSHRANALNPMIKWICANL